MVEAFGERGTALLPACRGRHAHLGQCDESCSERPRTVLLGASNTWFPVTMSVLAIPTKSEKLQQLVEDSWGLLREIPSREVLPHVITPLEAAGQLPGIGEFELDDVWRAIEEKRQGREAPDEDHGVMDFKGPEWEVFTSSNPPSDWPDFMVKRVEPPVDFREHFHSVVLAERLREVNALVAFTRVEPPEEGREGGDPPPRAPLSRGRPEWVPAVDVRGEGIFLRFQTSPLRDWLRKDAVRVRERALLQGHRNWRTTRRLEPLEANFPGILYILLHTFAHVLMRELSLECGYGGASLRERIYSSAPGQSPEMAGVLLYTAAPDSDGTLGGLVDLGRPENLGRLVTQAFGRAKICSSDPLCAEHVPTQDRALHGAACHACSFVSETSCELGNRYLDRSLLVPNLHGADLAFFEDVGS